MCILVTMYLYRSSYSAIYHVDIWWDLLPWTPEPVFSLNLLLKSMN